jgi:ATP-binding cassette, subfamily B, bacterial
MNYQLTESGSSRVQNWKGIGGLWDLLRDQHARIGLALLALVGSTLFNLSCPTLIGYAIDHFLVAGQYTRILQCCGLLLLLSGAGSACQYVQTFWMGGVGQTLLYRLRKQLFEKIQQLPLAFFQVNRAGDLISRLNNDTDRVNSFFSQSLIQFFGSLLGMLGSAGFLLWLNLYLGMAALLPAICLGLLMGLLSPWTTAVNALSLKTQGNLNSEISDCLENYKVIVSYHRQDYFLQRFEQANRSSYSVALRAGLVNKLFVPLFALSSGLAQVGVMVYGLDLVAHGKLTIGLLLSFLIYVIRFYDPLRQMAQLWAGLQSALAGWDRISNVLRLQTNLETLPEATGKGSSRLEFCDVEFSYWSEKSEVAPVLKAVNLRLEPGRTYALVGPTGGGKTTTASLMARLYDPTKGAIYLNGRDLRSFTPQERSSAIGFILQDPFLQGGSLRDNLSYANPNYLDDCIEEMGMSELLQSFPGGLDCEVDSLSLGQRQIVAFMRAVLRKPDLLILDEATANIDTVTERLLSQILSRLPKETTQLIIAHRLNTIEKADEIFFVNQGQVLRAGSMDQAVAMLRDGQRNS